ncbi:hypothetical protein DTQ13_08655 [Parasaccharibacter sp. TMW 2.1888]|nr:hypothetical protein DTQ13_08655 [Parasaccharibacter sp. TMW 2.1888]
MRTVIALAEFLKNQSEKVSANELLERANSLIEEAERNEGPLADPKRKRGSLPNFSKFAGSGIKGEDFL